MMFKSIIRNYKNAGRQVSVGFCMAKSDGTGETIFEHKASALDIHNLSGRAQRDLAMQARQSVLGVPRGLKFSDVVWPVATALLVKDAPRLKTCRPNDYGLSLPYLCFLSECVSKEWSDMESRDLTVYLDGRVSIYWIGDNLSNDHFNLGNYKRA